MFFFGPFLAVAGAWIGRAAEAYGWARVRPAAWAVLLGVALGLFTPTGWVVGGTAGGAFGGLRHRSWADALRGGLVGAALGLAGWVMTWGYVLLVSTVAAG